MLDFKQSPPLALYIHIPWCVKKCPYCDFNSHTYAEGLPESDYIAALIRDLEHELPSIWGREIISIFIGGGTPSLFSPESIDRLLSELRARLNLKPFIETTMEANPGTLETGRLHEFRHCGINRLSLGIQSFNDKALKQLGRIHSADDAKQAIETALTAGFDSFNLDLMYGLPNQTEAEALSDIETAAAYTPKHISHYQLTIEPDTAFHKRPPTLPTDEHIWQMQQNCQQRLAAAGFEHYEISAYAQKGHRCLHNENYWHFGDYVGIGAGAHQKLTHLQQQYIQRRWKNRLPKDYLSAQADGFTEGESKPNRKDLIFEFMLNALRLTNGFPANLFYQHTGMPIAVISQALQQAEEQGLLSYSRDHIQPTRAGQQYLNELLLLFLSDK